MVNSISETMMVERVTRHKRIDVTIVFHVTVDDMPSLQYCARKASCATSEEMVFPSRMKCLENQF